MPVHIAIDVRRLKDFGIGTYIRNLVRRLGTLDHTNRYTLVTSPDLPAELGGLPPNFETAPYPPAESGPLADIRLSMFLRRFHADVYHIPLNAVPLAMPKPYIVTVHDMSSLMFGHRPGWRNAYRRYRFRNGLNQADRVLAVSSATRRDVEHFMRIPRERIVTIYNAPDPVFAETGSTPNEDARILDRYQIHYPFLLYAGTIRKQKNIPRLVEAFSVLRGELASHPVYKDLRLVIIGDEISNYPSVRRTVIQSGVEHRVRFLGFVPIETLRVFYRAAAAFVFPSLYEGFGLPPLEAMSCGTPVVCSNVSSLPEVVGDAAMIVNPENVFEIARGMREVLLDDELRMRLIAKGREQAARFSWETAASQVLKTYSDVAARTAE